MRKFLVKVNGQDYEVAVEEITSAAPALVTELKPAAPAPASAPAAPAPKEAPAPKAAAGANDIVSPMPGNILSIAVKAGDAVKRGQILLILEAMKMENEIMAPADGTVVAVHVQVGTSVDTGAPLVTMG